MQSFGKRKNYSRLIYAWNQPYEGWLKMEDMGKKENVNIENRAQGDSNFWSTEQLLCILGPMYHNN